ncbi:MAG: diaminopimelate dehydrogenase [Candidatus Saliniplasma sp.]
MKAGIVGYGNLGKGVKAAIRQNPDIELVGIFTRRDPKALKVKSEDVDVVNVDQAEDYISKIDVMLLCGGSATDLPVQGPKFASMFNTVDSYDNHERIPDYYEEMNRVAKENGTLSAVSIGWDPGLFSMNRMLAGAILPEGRDYTFWGSGVSQGHSDALRRIEGVKDAVQYTIPIEETIDRVRDGENPDLTASDGHRRECYVVVEDGADKARIEDEIKSMPNYFEHYETNVNFVTKKELNRDHSEMPHGGFVIRSGRTGFDKEKNQTYEFGLDLESNPEFTASVLVAYARAVNRLSKEGAAGAKTVFDIPLCYLSPKSDTELRAEML